ncbi:lipid II flippase MurJ [subsurface metagenome]
MVLLGITVWNVVAMLGLLGLPAGVTRYVSFYKGKGDKGRIKGTIVSALKISFPFSLLLALLLFLTAGWLSVNIFHESNIAPILQILSIAIPFWVVALIFLHVAIGFQDMKYYVYVERIFQEGFKLAIILILLYLGFGVFGVVIGWTMTFMIMPFLAFYFLERKIFPIFKNKITSISTRKELFSFSLPLLFTGVLVLIMGYTDTLMLGYFSLTYDVGLYNVALPIAASLGTVSAAFTQIFGSTITELYSLGKDKEMGKIYSVATKWILSIVFPAFLLMFLFSRQIIGIIFGMDYIAASTALRILSFAYLISSLFNLSGRVISAVGRTKLIFLTHFIGAIANVALNFYLIPLYNINGAAMATAISIVILFILSFLFAYHIKKMQPFKVIYLKPIFAAIIAILLTYVLTKYLLGTSFLILVLMLFVFLGVYLVLLLLFKSFDEEDLMIMTAVEQRFGIRAEFLKSVIRRFL